MSKALGYADTAGFPLTNKYHNQKGHMMKKHFISAATLVALLAISSPVSAEDSPELKKWKECVAKVKKDYPVPPGNVNTQKQMIEQECGKKPEK